ncbi:MAG: hypothetical protein JNL47_10305 [Bacteroidia bacterium]|nr:hypothetical protein [Bacteroidia bacterium]
MRLNFSILALLVSLQSSAQFYQGMTQSFGKNRVQYNDFLWNFYRFKNVDVYFYLGGNELAGFIGKTADEDMGDIERMFDYKISGRLQVMVFNRMSDMKQTNIGLETDEMENGNIGGVTRVIGNKVLICFDGDHNNLRSAFRAGVSRVLLEQLMYGGNIKDRIQSSVLLHLPYWYAEGLAAYVGYGFDAEMDNKLRDGFLSKRYLKFNRMTEENELLAGISMWHYIAETYGQTAIANLLYLTRINKNIESGISYVLGISLKQLAADWSSFYQKRYMQDERSRHQPAGQTVNVKMKKKHILTQAKLSPDAGTIAYVTNDLGRYRVFLYDMAAGKSRRIKKGGLKSIEFENDMSFPLIQWHPSGRTLTIIYENKGNVWLDNYNLSEKKLEKNKFFYYEKVTSFSYSDDGNSMAITGVQKGQSDVFVFNVRARTSQNITNDLFDDSDARFMPGNKFIVFSSNRPSDSLRSELFKDTPPLKYYDLFLYDYYGRSEVLKRISQTEQANEFQPLPISPSSLVYLSDRNGIFNTYFAGIDSVLSFVDTTEHYRYIIREQPHSNFSRNIDHHDLNFKKTRYLQTRLMNRRHEFILSPNPFSDTLALKNIEPEPTQFALLKRKTIPKFKSAQVVTRPESEIIQKDIPADTIAKPKTDKIDINNYVFQSEFQRKKPPVDSTAVSKTDSLPAIFPLAPSQPADTSFRLPKRRNYDPVFSANYFVAQLDNSLLNATYQTFTGGAVYFDPGLTGLFKIGISDLMNDYKITAGFKLSGDLNSNEYLLVFDDLKRRIDKQYVFFRQAREFSIGPFFLKVHTHEFKYRLGFPLNETTSIRGTAAYRHDRTVVKSTDIIPLQIQNFYENWASLKAEFVYDNTIKRGLNLHNGTRLKVFTEGFRQVDESKTFMGVVGVDIRHYLKLHRQIIWANRFAASTSFGNLKLIYYLGSVDNTFVPTNNFNYDISIDFSQNYAFQTLGSPMRGFIQNIRNGNSFALINSEIRVPLFQYLLQRPIRSDLIRNFQVVGFGDAGTAWTGWDPYGKDNSLNTQTISGNPITIILQKQIEPIVGGFGFGLRSRILGYFLKADWAWGIEDRKLNDRIFYLSLGLDF